MGGLSDYLSKNYGVKSGKKKSKLRSKNSNCSDQKNSNTSHNSKQRTILLDDKLIEDATHINNMMNLSGSDKGKGVNPVVSRLVLKKSKIEKKATNNVSEIISNSIAKKEITTIKPEIQTVYRDSSGRKIENVEDYLEKRNQNEEYIKLKKSQFHKEDNAGEQQKLEKLKLEEDLQRISKLKTNVTRNDELLNKEMKSKILEDDPLLAMSSLLGKPMKESDKNVSTGLSNREGVSGSGRLLYSGSSMIPYNRFKIIPGCRWDGVNRSNGFEIRFAEKRYEREEKQNIRETMIQDDLDFDDD